MIEFDWTQLGNAVKLKQDGVLYEGFPGSSEVQIIPAGGVVQNITSFIERNNERYVQFDGNKYLLLSDKVEFVPAGTESSAGYFVSGLAWLKSLQMNAVSDVESAGKNVREGWKATKSRSFFEMLDYAGLSDVKKAITVAVIVFIAISIINLISKFR